MKRPAYPGIQEFVTGDLDTYVQGLPGVGGSNRAIAIRQPADIDSKMLMDTDAVFALAPFRCRGSGSGVKRLYLSYGAEIDEATARCFPNLSALRSENKSPIHLSWFAKAPLKALSIRGASAAKWSEIHGMDLEEVFVRWSGQPLEQLPPSIKKLTIAAWGNVKAGALAPIGTLPDLKSLALHSVSLPSLRMLTENRSLEELTVSTKSLRGIESLTKIRTLRLSGTSCPPLEPLGQLKQLQHLEIRTRFAPEDMSEIARLTNLADLSLELGKMYDVVGVSSLGFLASLAKLRRLTMFTIRVLDGDLSPLQRLPKLKAIRIVGDLGSGAKGLVKALTRRRISSSGIKTFSTVGGPPKPVLINGMWSLFDDLTNVFGVKSNYDVEKIVRREVKSEMPDAVRRLEFDTEAGLFCVRATDRRDIEKVASLLQKAVDRHAGVQAGR